MPTDVNLVVLNGCRPTKSKTTYPPIKINHPLAQIKTADTIVVGSGESGIYFSQQLQLTTSTQQPLKLGLAQTLES